MYNLYNNCDKFISDNIINVKTNENKNINISKDFKVLSGRIYIIAISLRSESSAWCHYFKYGIYYHAGTYPVNVKGPKIKWLYEDNLINSLSIENFNVKLSMNSDDLKIDISGTMQGNNTSATAIISIKEINNNLNLNL